MSTLPIYSEAKKQVGELPLPKFLADNYAKTGLVFDAVQAEMTNRRQGNACTKTRAEVRGGGRKPYKQKGTGNARQGSIRSPLCVGGGQTFGPRTREWEHRLPKGQRRAALLHALVLKHRAGKLMIVDQLQCEQPKTKAMVAKLKALGIANGLLITPAGNLALAMSVRNIHGVETIDAQHVNTTAVMRHDTIVVTKDALTALEQRCAL